MGYDSLADRISECDCKVAAAIALNGRLPERYILKTELKLHRGFGGSTRGARLDMAVIDRETDRIVLVIETKRSPASKASAQGERYGKMCAARVIYLRGMKACSECAERVLSALPPG
ncbi:MAG: hypothetical protein U1E51_06870 [Candidatus Binatia bacterium]|nr:hypothetical protein [Candidatus Binatia bacterium]